ncbi:MAG: DUF4384 domain-containing protein [Acidobacteria bacterium]|nr:DUF4384 domain-containing protein [Acidobacteriota bacterium]
MRILSGLSILALACAAQQDPDERTRALWNEAFLDKRPPARKAAPARTSSAPAPTPAPVPVQPLPPAAVQEVGDALVGVTVWRQDESKDEPERCEMDTPLTAGQKVRISIETARSGYLYVIDRDQYADGAFSAPFLIFPTVRTHSGNNEVRAGRLVEIPDAKDTPPYLTVSPSRSDQVAEMLTVLVTPKPLPGLKIGREPLKLTPEQVEEWQKKWGSGFKRLEARGQAGKPITKAEKEAGLERTRLLTHDDPLPQTMYRLEAKPGDPLLLSVPLKIGKQ